MDFYNNLQNNQQYLRTIIENSLDSFIVIDAQGHVVEWNQQASKTFGWTREEVIGNPLVEFIIPENAKQQYEKEFQKLLQDGQGEVLNKRIQIEVIDRFSEVFPVELTISSIQTDSGYTFSAFLRDIREQKEVEQKLLDAKNLAEKANQAKSDFLANMSHEIRTPMNGVIGMTDLLLETPLSQDQRSLAETVQTSAEALLTIVNDILDFSKIEASKFDLHKTKFSIGTWLDKTIRMLEVHAKSKRQELVSVIDQNIPPRLIGDPARLQQVLVNLISNSIKFTQEQGGILVMIELRSKNEKQAVLHFSVSDSGTGIPKDKLKVIFEAFSQADGTISRRYGGTGLGLSISKGLVELMGGKIWVESSQGVGTVFHIKIPFEYSEQDDRSELHNQNLLDKINGSSILVVDEDAARAKTFETMLRSWNMKPTSVNCWVKAVELSKNKDDFDAIIVNCPDSTSEFEQGTFKLSDQCDPSIACLFLVTRKSTSLGDSADSNKNVKCMFKPATYSSLLDSLVELIDECKKGSNEPQTAMLDTARDSSQLNVLVAEDNLVNQKLTSKLLEKQGYTVTVVEHGRAVLEALEENDFDIILMDIQMPEMGGDEATKKIRASKKSYASIPIVALTANAMKGDQERYMSLGMNGYVSKPIDKCKLFNVIHEVLQTRRGN